MVKKENVFQKKLRKEILIYSVIIIVLMTLILGVMLVGYNYRIVKMEMNKEETELNSYVSTTVNAYETELRKNEKHLYLNFLNNEIPETTLYSQLYSFNSTQEIKSNFILFDRERNIKFSTNTNLEHDGSLLSYTKIVTERIESGKINIIQKIFMNSDKEHYLLVGIPIIEKNVVKGYAIFFLNGKEVEASLNHLSVRYIFYDKYSNIFSSNSDTFKKGTLEKIDTSLIEKRYTYNKQLFLSSKTKVTPYINLIVYNKVTPYNSLLKLSITGIILISSVLTLLAYYFSKKISINSSKSIELISKEMEKVKKDSSYRIKLQTNDEFNLLTVNINKMLQEINELHNTNIMLLKENLIAEKKKLEAQFNPHFLYNTLEIIRSSVHFDKDLANRLILSLNSILRYSINEENNEVILESDLVYLEKYLEISKNRFEFFNYEIEVDPESAALHIPKLFLLPIIENSLKYGFQNIIDLFIHIKIVQIDENITRIVIKDNGNSLDKKKALIINENLQNSEDIKNHHGLNNSRKRLLLMYPCSSFRIFVRNKHTIVEIIIRKESA